MKRDRLTALIAVTALTIAACTTAAGDTTTTGGPGATGPVGGGGSVLAAVMDRGSINCGVNNAVPGFGFVDADGNHVGFDIDFCHALAAAVFGDPDAVEFIDLTAEQRFTALQSGEIDVLIRNTTWTSSRDGTLGATFLTTTFYDGQGMMVRSDSGFTSIDDMADTTICVLSGTTTELNLATRMTGIGYTPSTFDDNGQIQAAFLEGACDGWTSDKSQLAGVRSAWPEDDGGPEALTILDETFSKEPLGPAVRDGDAQWAQIVDWVVIATIQAEEFGITQDNVNGFADTENNDIRRFLGLEITDAEGNTSVFDAGLGLPADFAAEVVAAVGNYAEIYDRNVGPDTPLGLERGVNALWTNGGLHYPPPHR
ncbi:MAG: amino acid ABC transporter substrate-binding protein [Actinobacteria bacterium]|nr:amino acid ABC transporter substrate-binding protein [Actinomycetota bacterium]MCI0542998.1 amino acid ABC transporter substrate-binding protein [Actinomycetota bacterium]MCI0678659.1 amino acid ABC transporter substrate-binding protein [Actinomycetota bacterium]